MPAINPNSIRPPFARYSHGKTDDSGQWLVTSGQLGVTFDDTCPGDARSQADLCFANLLSILTEAGMTRQDILRLNAYVKDRSHLQDYMAARDAWLQDIDPPPASTLMIVSGFARVEFKVEIELIAYRSNK